MGGRILKISREEFLKNSAAALGEIYDLLAALPELALDSLDPEKTVLVIVDMINAFARTGPLQSPRVEALIPEVVRVLKLCRRRGIGAIAFADSHSRRSPEFDSYPAHALAGTAESEVVDEIKEVGGYTLFAKNSTNGFLEEGFQNWFSSHPHLENFIVVGDCTDICVQQFALSLKAYSNMRDERRRVIVPVNAVDTYDLGAHNGDLTHVMALFNMMGNGVELYSRVGD